MTAFYRSFLASSNISFSYVGALDGNVVAKRIERIFKDLPNGKNSEIAPLMLYPAKDFKLIEEEMNVKQGVLVIGMRTGTLLGEYDAPVMTVFNNVYGGTYMSRLFKTVREKMSLCYYCSSDFISTKAVMYVSCGIDVANFERAKDEILAQLEMLKRERVTDEELAVAKDLAVKELREMTDYPSAIATFSYSRDIYGIKDTIESLSEKIEKVSSDDILRVANKIEPSAVFFLKGIKNDEAEEEDFYGE
jgi:predicted Zn-dependent peptidase